MRVLLDRSGSLVDWAAFAASWDDLTIDHYLADQGRYRRRRHAVFHVGNSGESRREAHQPHYQSRDYNHLHGGIERWFEPVSEQVGNSASLRCILDFCSRLLAR